MDEDDEDDDDERRTRNRVSSMPSRKSRTDHMDELDPIGRDRPWSDGCGRRVVECRADERCESARSETRTWA